MSCHLQPQHGLQPPAPRWGENYFAGCQPVFCVAGWSLQSADENLVRGWRDWKVPLPDTGLLWDRQDFFIFILQVQSTRPGFQQ